MSCTRRASSACSSGVNPRCSTGSAQNQAAEYEHCCIVNCLSICPYCSFTPEDAWIVSDEVVAIPHPFPLASCHVLVAPRRHVAGFYDLDVGEQRQIWEVLNELRKRITLSLHVEGFDV